MLGGLLDDDVDALDLHRHHVRRPVAIDVDRRVLWVEVHLKEIARLPLARAELRNVEIDSPADEKKPAPPGGVSVIGPAKHAPNEPGRCLDDDGFVDDAKRHHDAA